jgi:hypothetical protein
MREGAGPGQIARPQLTQLIVCCFAAFSRVLPREAWKRSLGPAARD